MAFLLMGAGLLLFGAGALIQANTNRNRRGCVAHFRPRIQSYARVPCIQSHSEEGFNYPWLQHIHGGLAYIEYEEPPGSGVWRRYTRQTWEAHCRVVSHDPANLAADHIEAFINPATRFARLRFNFRDGTAMEPIPYFYELEAAWIQRYGQY